MCKHLLGFRTDISSLFTIRNTCNVCAWNVISWVLSHNQYVCHKIETGHVNKHWQRWMFAGFYVRLGESFMALFLGNCLSKYPLTGWMSSIHDVTFVSVTCCVTGSVQLSLFFIPNRYSWNFCWNFCWILFQLCRVANLAKCFHFAKWSISLLWRSLKLFWNCLFISRLLFCRRLLC